MPATEESTGSENQTKRRKRNENQSSWQRRNRQRFGRASGVELRRELPHGSRGFLITCNPKHEAQCFREATVLLGEQVEKLVPRLAQSFDASSTPNTSPSHPAEHGDGKSSSVISVTDAVSAELESLRQPVRHRVFTRIDWSVQGSVFIRVEDEDIQVERVVENAMLHARDNQTPGCRNCVRVLPIHTTCYAKSTDAAHAAKVVVQQHFPPDAQNYAIVFRSRLNSDAHRDDYIKDIAAAIESTKPSKLKVNLTEPDVVLLVEVLRTVCVIGCFAPYYKLAKLNIREVAQLPKRDGVEKTQATEREQDESRAKSMEIRSGRGGSCSSQNTKPRPAEVESKSSDDPKPQVEAVASLE